MASTTISNNFVKQFGSTLEMLLDVRSNPFSDKCMQDTITGEEKYYDQLGSVVANEVLDRYGDSPQNDIAHDRRRVIATPYDVGLMLDQFDKVQMLVDPESEYVTRMVEALESKKAIEFFKGALGTAYSGKGGGTSNDLSSTYFVASSEGSTGATGMNVAKLRKAKQLLLEAGVDFMRDKAYIAMGPQEQMELLESTEVTSADYNTVRALVNGEVNTFMGFEFVFSNQIPYANTAGTGFHLTWDSNDLPVDTDTTDVAACFAWVKSGVRQVQNPEVKTNVTERWDKRGNWYAYGCVRTGAMRTEERKVVPILCDRSPA